MSGLQDVFAQGDYCLVQKQWDKAERLFRELLEADSNDWEAREKLVQVYQGWNKESEADNQIYEMRKMTFRGRAWRSRFCRDRFGYLGNRVEVQETALPEFPIIQSIRFHVRNAESGNFRFSIVMVLKEKQLSVFSDALPAFKALALPGYELSIRFPGRRRAYQFLNRRPTYAEMKDIVTQIVEHQ